MRYFIGVGLPYELQEKISQLRSQWQHFKLPPLKFPHGVQPHITIKSPFETTRDDWLPAIEEICTKAQAFQISLGTIKSFHNEVIYISAESEELMALNQFTTGALLDLGIHDDADHYPYTPHCTLGYAHPHVNTIQIEKIRSTALIEIGLPITFHARSIQVFVKDDNEDRYDILTEFDLVV